MRRILEKIERRAEVCLAQCHHVVYIPRGGAPGPTWPGVGPGPAAGPSGPPGALAEGLSEINDETYALQVISCDRKLEVGA